MLLEAGLEEDVRFGAPGVETEAGNGWEERDWAAGGWELVDGEGVDGDGEVVDREGGDDDVEGCEAGICEAGDRDADVWEALDCKALAGGSVK